MYTVEIRHHTKNWRNGDLEGKLELVDSKNFKAKKAAKLFIESELGGKRNVSCSYHKGDTPSYCYWFTGKTWQHENTGEEMQEYYQYKLSKTKVS